jgi:hypothetical protein
MNLLRSKHRWGPRRRARWAVAAVTLVMAGGIVEVGSANPAAAATSLAITGGDSTAETVCGNVAVAQEYARRRGIRLQRNNCTALATGGSVTLSDVNIYLSASAASRAISEITQIRSRQTRDLCDTNRRSPGRGFQINICSGTARSGTIALNNVTQVVHARDGQTSTRRIAAESGPPRNIPPISARCANVNAEGIDQQDDCTGDGSGASWAVRGVDVEHRGSGVWQRGVDVVLRGGRAVATVRCFNTTDGSGRVFQINRCYAVAEGGTISLNNVAFHVVV